MEYYVIVFKNTYDAMNAEKKLKELNFEFNIMPTPTNITMSCGICVRMTSEQSIDDIKNNKIIEFKNIYKKTSNEYILES